MRNACNIYDQQVISHKPQKEHLTNDSGRLAQEQYSISAHQEAVLLIPLGSKIGNIEYAALTLNQISQQRIEPFRLGKPASIDGSYTAKINRKHASQQ